MDGNAQKTHTNTFENVMKGNIKVPQTKRFSKSCTLNELEWSCVHVPCIFCWHRLLSRSSSNSSVHSLNRVLTQKNKKTKYRYQNYYIRSHCLAVSFSHSIFRAVVFNGSTSSCFKTYKACLIHTHIDICEQFCSWCIECLCVKRVFVCTWSEKILMAQCCDCCASSWPAKWVS